MSRNFPLSFPVTARAAQPTDEELCMQTLDGTVPANRVDLMEAQLRRRWAQKRARQLGWQHCDLARSTDATGVTTWTERGGRIVAVSSSREQDRRTVWRLNRALAPRPSLLGPVLLAAALVALVAVAALVALHP
jgi:hypothetical protein